MRNGAKIGKETSVPKEGKIEGLKEGETKGNDGPAGNEWRGGGGPEERNQIGREINSEEESKEGMWGKQIKRL